MKQGQAQTSKMGSTKVEPTSRGVSIEYVADCGLQHVKATSVPMYEGRGLEAPMAGQETYHCGSQGKHK